MSDFLSPIISSMDSMGSNFSQQAYATLGSEIVPVLKIACTMYVAVYGMQLMMGASTLSGREIIIRVSKMVFIIALLQSWSTFNTLFYGWLTNAPDQIGKVILSASSTGVSDVSSGLSTVWQTANEVSSAFSRQSGYWAVLPALIGIGIWIATGIFIGIALALIILAKVMMWVLMASAPIFIGCMLFDRTKGLGDSWFQQVLLYALIPTFVYVIAAFMISILNQMLNGVSSAATASTIQLSDVAGFFLMTIAGAYVLLNVQSLAQGIAGGLSISASSFANGVAVGPMKFIGSKMKQGAWAATSAGAGAAYRAARSKFQGGGGSISPSDPASTALQTRIKNQSSPK